METRDKKNTHTQGKRLNFPVLERTQIRTSPERATWQQLPKRQPHVASDPWFHF